MRSDIEEVTVWICVLAYCRTICKRINDVRTVSSLNFKENMIYWPFVSTKMLDGYSMLKWVRHFNVTFSLVILLLKKEGAAASKIKKLKDMVAEHVTKNKNAISKLNKSAKDLKDKKADLKF